MASGEERPESGGTPEYRELVVLPAVAALATGVTLLAVPASESTILAVDVSLLGFGHVTATFMKVGTMPLSNRQRRILMVDSVIGVGALVVLALLYLPLLLVTTLYVLWSYVHVLRQAYGIERLLLRREKRSASSARMGWAFGVAGGAALLAMAQGSYLGLPIFRLPTSLEPATRLASIWLWGYVFWVWWRDPLSGLPRLFRLSQVAVFMVAYLGMPTLAQAWLVGNVWHNCQYVLIVRNNMQAATLPSRGVMAALVSWSRILRGGMIVLVCLATGFTVYKGLAVVMALPWTFVALPAFATYMVVNVHHYLVDGLIWKRSSKTLAALA